jgi:hypothetical protein
MMSSSPQLAWEGANRIQCSPENKMAHGGISALNEQLAVESLRLDDETLASAMFDGIVGCSEIAAARFERRRASRTYRLDGFDYGGDWQQEGTCCSRHTQTFAASESFIYAR